MKALVLTRDGYAEERPETVDNAALAPFVELREVERPSPEAGQVVVEVELASVNPSDTMFVAGLYGLPRQSGRVAGFEGVGRVVEAGPGLMGRWLKGKRVAFYGVHSGTWGEFALTDASACIPVKDALRAEDAAGFLVNPFTAYALHGLLRRAGAKSFVMNAAYSQMCKFLTSLAAE